MSKFLNHFFNNAQPSVSVLGYATIVNNLSNHCTTVCHGLLLFYFFFSSKEAVHKLIKYMTYQIPEFYFLCPFPDSFVVLIILSVQIPEE